MEWTPSQKQTIETRNKNILVSAAAGSGKTAVLIERIKQLMLKDKVDIDGFLITTFTNAASAEMKERLEKAINEEMKKEGADLKFLKKQLMLLPTANISTFHSFSNEVIKRFFYLTDLEPGVSIMADSEVDIMMADSINTLFSRQFEEAYDDFALFLKKYSSDRNENNIKNKIISLYKEIRSIPFYFEWAEKRIEIIESEEAVKGFGIYESLSGKCEKEIERATTYFEKAAELLESEGLVQLAKKAEEDALNVRDLCSENFKLGMDSLKYNRMQPKKEEKEAFGYVKSEVEAFRKKGKEMLKNFYNKYYQKSEEEYNKEIKENYHDTVYLINLMKEFEVILKEMKRDKNCIDNDDLMHYALEILENSMAADEYRKKFKYIFIDEFQDSNMLQEAIIERISRNNNLFMVGDIKQSIYKFRLAEPEIFKKKYELYSKETETDSIKIDLNSNFRSKNSITTLVNRTFASIMDEYDDNAELKCSISDEYPGFEPQLHLIKTSDESDNDGFDKSEIEARLVAKLVKANLGKTIFDTKQNKYRTVEFSDIAVLSRTRAILSNIEKELHDMDIPAIGEGSGGYLESIEIKVFLNFLRIIDNFKQDIPLISVMRCPIFNFSFKELASIRVKSKKKSFNDAVKQYIKNGDDEKIRKKLIEFENNLNYWKALRQTVPLEEFISVLLYDTGFYDYFSGLPGGKQRAYNLQFLLEEAEKFEKRNYTGLYGFIMYIEALETNKISVKEAAIPLESENAVKLMTIHKSKGLEFPIVILAGAGREIKPEGIGKSFGMHKDISISIPSVNISEKWYKRNLLHRIIDVKKNEENFYEEMRILYVAMTRAMDGLIIVGSVKDTESLSKDYVEDMNTYIKMVYNVFNCYEYDIIEYDDTDIVVEAKVPVGSRMRLVKAFNRAGKIDGDNEKICEFSRILSYNYPYIHLDKVKSKYSVTELNKKSYESNRQIVLKKPNFKDENIVITPAQIGTVMHLVMEKLDFKTAALNESGYIRAVVENLIKENMINEDESKKINLAGIEAFFADNIGKRASNAQRLEKEKEFIMLKAVDGVESIVQGVIDCYFEEDNELILIDYKNSNYFGTNESEIIMKYKTQMEIYREVLEKAEKKQVKEMYLYLFEAKKFIEIK